MICFPVWKKVGGVLPPVGEEDYVGYHLLQIVPYVPAGIPNGGVAIIHNVFSLQIELGGTGGGWDSSAVVSTYGASAWIHYGAIFNVSYGASAGVHDSTILHVSHGTTARSPNGVPRHLCYSGVATIHDIHVKLHNIFPFSFFPHSISNPWINP